MAQIDIVVGTVYGAAMLVAETLAAQLEQAGHGCQVFEDAELAVLDASRFLLVITATTGQGDIPPNLQPLATALADRAPYMKGWRYALVAMGTAATSTSAGPVVTLMRCCRSSVPALCCPDWR